MKYYEIDFHIKPTTDGHTDYEMIVQNTRDIIAALAGETGFETFEDTEDGMKGYVQTCLFDRDALDMAIATVPFDSVRVTYEINEAEDKDWNEAWENEGFEPIAIGERCVIHDGRHLPTSNSYDISIEIDARLAFGTGNHETTRMVAGTLLATDMDGKKMLDCGCGTGILGIIALKCGAKRAVGYDIDEWSVDNARHNAVINRVDDRFCSMLGDASILDSIGERFDIVTANINRNILLNDMSAFRSVMNDGAALVISGFYCEDMDILKTKASELSLTLSQTSESNGWACMMFRVGQ